MLASLQLPPSEPMKTTRRFGWICKYQDLSREGVRRNREYMVLWVTFLNPLDGTAGGEISFFRQAGASWLVQANHSCCFVPLLFFFCFPLLLIFSFVFPLSFLLLRRKLYLESQGRWRFSNECLMVTGFACTPLHGARRRDWTFRFFRGLNAA